METFKLADLSQRLLPMVELIDEFDQPINLASLFSPTNAIHNTALLSPPGSSLESSPSFTNAKTTLLDKTIEVDDKSDLQINDVFDDGIDLGTPMDDVLIVPDMVPDVETHEASERTFDSDQFDISNDDSHYDEREEADPYQTIVEHGDRVQVTGPVAPRPLSPSTTHDFNQGTLKARQRPQKKKGSPVMQLVKVVLGGAAAIPLAAVILSLVGKPLNLGFWPLDGTPLTKIMAGAPMELDDSRPSRPKSLPGRSLAEDLNLNAETDTPKPASTSDTVPDEPTTDDNNASALPDGVALPTTAENPIEEPALVAKPSETPDSFINPVKPESGIKAAPPEDKAFIDAVSGGSNDGNEPEINPAPPISVSFAPAASPELAAAIKKTDQAVRDVIDFKDPSNVKAFQAVKGRVYADLASLALLPPGSGQDETSALIKRVVDADLIKDMIIIGPNWMKYKKRDIDGLFAVGKLVRTGDNWILKWNGVDLQLKNVSESEFSQEKDEAIDVFLIGKIIDAKPPSIIEVVYMKRQTSH